MRQWLQQHLPAGRYAHCEGTAETAVALAARTGADQHKAYLAGWLHDAAKSLSLGEMRRYAQGEPQLDSMLWNSRNLLHAPASSGLCRKLFAIDDEEILAAIRWHTTGRVGMSLLERIVFLADAMEPTRNYQGVEEIRRAAQDSIESGMLASYRETFCFLLESGQPIHPVGIVARNAILEELRPTKGEPIP